jgi:hypothetical protein
LLLIDLEAVSNRLFGIIEPTPRHEALGQLVFVDFEEHNHVKPVLADESVKRGDLWFGPRKTVEDETIEGVRLLETLTEHLNGDLVGNICARLHDGLYLATQLGALLDMMTKHLTGGNVRNSETLSDPRRLGSLTRPGRSDEEKLHGFR